MGDCTTTSRPKTTRDHDQRQHNTNLPSCRFLQERTNHPMNPICSPKSNPPVDVIHKEEVGLKLGLTLHSKIGFSNEQVANERIELQRNHCARIGGIIKDLIAKRGDFTSTVKRFSFPNSLGGVPKTVVWKRKKLIPWSYLFHRGPSPEIILYIGRKG